MEGGSVTADNKEAVPVFLSERLGGVSKMFPCCETPCPDLPSGIAGPARGWNAMHISFLLPSPLSSMSWSFFVSFSVLGDLQEEGRKLLHHL